ncbi:B12-binding domain-containing radical SAM protein, partial [Candidatus Sumerlaeota bacterium]|nr:B12-binding domain-containing radical SAM protein [Candidatus Sumerlaeota bacterium]
MPVRFEEIEPLLLKVEKPGRYVGGEFNAIVKESPDVTVRCCLAFPDVYDLGMSYHGYSLLYERINRTPRWAAERAFTPWPDFELLLRENKIPLHSIETRRALAEFDVVGFTLQHEVNYTNMLTMLDLGGIPIESKDRKSPFPLVIGGGEGAYSPEPMSPYFDAFVIGDGEEAMEDVCRIVERAKAETWTRDQLLMALAQTPGIYVPEFYDVEYLEDGRVKRVYPIRDGVPPTIKKRHFDITQDHGSTRPVVPLLRTVHDRLAIEIRRGCVNGCRFCQAGMITR